MPGLGSLDDRRLLGCCRWCVVVPAAASFSVYCSYDSAPSNRETVFAPRRTDVTVRMSSTWILPSSPGRDVLNHDL
eukprot:scaffold935_cov155-Amphora_coffeaeformis.AAC.3